MKQQQQQAQFWQQMSKKYEDRMAALRQQEQEQTNPTKEPSLAPEPPAPPPSSGLNPCALFRNIIQQAKCILPSAANNKVVQPQPESHDQLNNDDPCSCNPCSPSTNSAADNNSTQSSEYLRDCCCNPCFADDYNGNDKASLRDCQCNPCNDGTVSLDRSSKMSKNMPSLFSLKTIDIEQMKNLTELALAEKELKCRLNNQDCSNINNKQPADLVQQNTLLKNELDDLKMELRHQMETVKGPMQHQLDKEKYKYQQLEQQMQQVSKELTESQDFHLKEMNSLKMQLCCTCSNMNELSALNDRLRDELKGLEGKHNQLQDDMIRQKLSEADTIKRLTREMDNIRASGGGGMDLSIQESCCDKNLHDIARKLSNALKESEACGECTEIPSDFACAAKYIKELADLVDNCFGQGDEVECVCGAQNESAQKSPIIVQNIDSVIKTEDSLNRKSSKRQNDQILITVDQPKMPSIAEATSDVEDTYSNELNEGASEGNEANLLDQNIPYEDEKSTNSKVGSVQDKSRISISTNKSTNNQESSVKDESRPQSLKQSLITNGSVDVKIEDNSDTATRTSSVKDKSRSQSLRQSLASGSVDLKIDDNFDTSTQAGSVKKNSQSIKNRSIDEEKKVIKAVQKKKKTCTCGKKQKANKSKQIKEICDLLKQNTITVVPDIQEVENPCPYPTKIKDTCVCGKKESSCPTPAVSKDRSCTPQEEIDVPFKKCVCNDKSTNIKQTVVDNDNVTVIDDTKSGMEGDKSGIEDDKSGIEDDTSKSGAENEKSGIEIAQHIHATAAETKSSTQMKALGDRKHLPVNIDTEVDVIDKPPDGLHVTTSITRSGTIEVTTEGPEGVIDTKLIYTDSGNIQVHTEILEENRALMTGKTEMKNMKRSNKQLAVMDVDENVDQFNPTADSTRIDIETDVENAVAEDAAADNKNVYY